MARGGRRPSPSEQVRIIKLLGRWPGATLEQIVAVLHLKRTSVAPNREHGQGKYECRDGRWYLLPPP
jgi:hypothetical protein